MVEQVLRLVITSGWVLVWVVALGVAIWQIVRGRTLAGLAIGLGALGGLLLQGLPSAASSLRPVLAGLGGIQVAIAIERVVFGLGHAGVVALLLVGATIQRPPKDEAGRKG